MGELRREGEIWGRVGVFACGGDVDDVTIDCQNTQKWQSLANLPKNRIRLHV